MAKKDEYINEAYKTLDKISADKMKRMEYEAREKAIRDYNHQMYHARKAGFDEGMKEGMKEGIRVLITMNQKYHMDYDIVKSQVQDAYGLSESEAEKVMRQYWR